MNLSVSTSCKQDSSQPVVVVADHISHSSSSQWFQRYHGWFVCCLGVKGVKKVFTNIMTVSVYTL